GWGLEAGMSAQKKKGEEESDPGVSYNDRSGPRSREPVRRAAAGGESRRAQQGRDGGSAPAVRKTRPETSPHDPAERQPGLRGALATGGGRARAAPRGRNRQGARGPHRLLRPQRRRVERAHRGQPLRKGSEGGS